MSWMGLESLLSPNAALRLTIVLRSKSPLECKRRLNDQHLIFLPPIYTTHAAAFLCVCVFSDNVCDEEPLPWLLLLRQSQFSFVNYGRIAHAGARDVASAAAPVAEMLSCNNGCRFSADKQCRDQHCDSRCIEENDCGFCCC